MSDDDSHVLSSLAQAATRKTGSGRKKMREAAAQRRRIVCGVVDAKASRSVWHVDDRFLKSSISWRKLGRNWRSSVGRLRSKEVSVEVIVSRDQLNPMSNRETSSVQQMPRA